MIRIRREHERLFAGAVESLFEYPSSLEEI
jgi:hypothetical protein